LQACDEHTLRERLIAEPAAAPMRHVIVTTADWIADPDGLFVGDFDMLARIPGLEALDIVSTEPVLGSGFHERLHDWLPGLEEVGPSDLGVPTSRVRPMLVTPGVEEGQTWFTYRDRGEELVGIARQIKACRGSKDDFAPLDRTAVVFKRPLPYLYLADGAFGEAGILSGVGRAAARRRADSRGHRPRPGARGDLLHARRHRRAAAIAPFPFRT
jgi:hypothetical protein